LEPFFREDKKKLFQTSFYKSERNRLNILLDSNNNPVGGKWTYDDQNREKYPKGKTTPKIKVIVLV
jgi:deoxyribodipyrimidine photolyase-related protein